jgi:hypothetical protein
MKTAIGVILAAVLAAGVGVLGVVVTANLALASSDKAASQVTPAATAAPTGYQGS